MALHSTSEQEVMFLYGPVRRRTGRWSGPAGSGAHLHAKAARRRPLAARSLGAKGERLLQGS